MFPQDYNHRNWRILSTKSWSHSKVKASTGMFSFGDWKLKFLKKLVVIALLKNQS